MLMTPTKKCSKCGLEKSRLAFDKDRRAKDKLRSQCKSCRVKYRASHKVEAAEYNRGYYQDNRTEILEQKRSPTGKESLRKSDEKQRLKFPERIKARCAVNNAIRDGELIRPSHCEDCNKKKFVQGHHESYEEDRWLDVDCLGIKCHRRLHRKKKLLEGSNGTDKQ